MFKQRANLKEDTYCELFLCVPNIYGSKIHKELFIYSLIKGDKPDRDKIWDYLNSLLPEDPKVTEVVFLFDEAQKLLEQDAIYFRYIRWWLRELGRKQNVVAVFTGTTCKLCKYFPENTILSGDGRNPNSRYWNPVGDFECYDPFYELTTMGSWSFLVDHKHIELSEYKLATLYGRPLFAALQMDENKETGLNDTKRYAILERMLLQYKDYSSCESALMNILGTRVQMGHVSVNLASRLVSSGYAHLVGFRPRALTNKIKEERRRGDDDVAIICYQPDPVCAHLAMCLMDGNWKMKQIRGSNAKFWTAAATELLSSGVCYPSKGDVGEVAAALYLLLCGDVIRQKLDANYMTFSVDLSSYIKELLANSTIGAEVDVGSDPLNSTLKYKVNFIQIVWQYFRAPLKYLFESDILEWMSRSACAMYLPSSSPVFDILAPIKCIDEEGNTSYVPLAISVKSRREFEASCVQNEFERMKKEMVKLNVQGGVCLLVLLDLETDTLTSSTRLDLNDATIDLTQTIVYKAVAIQNDDFGVSKLVQNTRVGNNKECEIYSSHAMLPYLSTSLWEEKIGRYNGETWDYAQLAAVRDPIEK